MSSPNDDPTWLGMRTEMIAAIVEEGSSTAKPVAAHAIGRAGIRASVEAGVHSLSTGTNSTTICDSR